MFNMRILVASMITFVLLMIVWSQVTNHGYDKLKPQLDKRQEQAKQMQEQYQQLAAEDMAGLGASSETIHGANIPLTEEERNEFMGMTASVRPLRPIGIWMGVCKDDRSRLAIIEFKKNTYKLLIKDPQQGEIKEEGDYAYEYTDIYFNPKDNESYGMGYEMFSASEMMLYGSDRQFTFEKANDVNLDF